MPFFWDWIYILFLAIHWQTLFQRLPKSKKTVALDGRFMRMLDPKDKLFAGAVGRPALHIHLDYLLSYSKGKKDARGRQHIVGKKEDLGRFYSSTAIEDTKYLLFPPQH